MTLQESRERLRRLHPIVKGIIFTLLAGITFFIEIWLVRNMRDFHREAIRAYAAYDLDRIGGVVNLVIQAPFQEELIYRGPVWLLAVLTGWAIRKHPGKKSVEYAAHALCALLLLPLNYVWAFSHCRYSYTIFAFGLVWGLCVILTRRLHYSMILHAGSNACAVIGISVIHYFSS